MFFNEVYVNNWLLSFPQHWQGIAIGVIIVVTLLFLLLFPLFQGRRFARLEAATCKADKTAFSLGPSTPYWISLIGAFVSAWIAYHGKMNGNGTISGLRNSLHPDDLGATFHCGLDFSSLVDYAFPLGFKFPIPAELALCLDTLGRYWFIPLAASVVSAILRIGIFRTPKDGIRYFLAVLAATYATYWIYGIYLTFTIMPLMMFVIFFGVGLVYFVAAGARGISRQETGRDEDGMREGEEEDQRREERRREEEYNRTHKTLEDGTFGGTEIEDHGILGWSDRDGNKYHENLDGTFTRED